jgi:signal peptidase I
VSVQLRQKTNGTGSVKKNSQWVEFFSLIKSLSIFFAIAFLLRASVVEAFKIPSSSMEPTLEIDDHILVNKLSYGLRVPFKAESVVEFKMPKRGDVVVFTLPDDPDTPEIDESETNIIKRVIGLPGDAIMVRGTKLFVNGKVYDEDEKYAVWLLGGRKDFGPVTVPPAKVLLLGDNRDQSKDSRFWPDPFLDAKRIKGRAFIIYWNLRMLWRMFHIIS